MNERNNIIEIESINTAIEIRVRKDLFTVLRTEMNLSRTKTRSNNDQTIRYLTLKTCRDYFANNENFRASQRLGVKRIFSWQRQECRSTQANNQPKYAFLTSSIVHLSR